jgi:hypothetical protein
LEAVEMDPTSTAHRTAEAYPILVDFMLDWLNVV